MQQYNTAQHRHSMVYMGLESTRHTTNVTSCVELTCSSSTSCVEMTCVELTAGDLSRYVPGGSKVILSPTRRRAVRVSTDFTFVT